MNQIILLILFNFLIYYLCKTNIYLAISIFLFMIYYIIRLRYNITNNIIEGQSYETYEEIDYKNNFINSLNDDIIKNRESKFYLDIVFDKLNMFLKKYISKENDVENIVKSTSLKMKLIDLDKFNFHNCSRWRRGGIDNYLLDKLGPGIFNRPWALGNLEDNDTWENLKIDPLSHPDDIELRYARKHQVPTVVLGNHPNEFLYYSIFITYVVFYDLEVHNFINYYYYYYYYYFNRRRNNFDNNYVRGILEVIKLRAWLTTCMYMTIYRDDNY